MMTDRELMQQALEALEANRRTHYYCEDIWYSCPKHEDGCANDAEGNECNCGADKANAEIDYVTAAIKEALAQPEQEPVACQYAKDVAMPEHRCATKCQYAQPEQEQWDAIPDAFNEWWNADYDDTGNPYRKDSPAYWAWSGWKAASKQPEQEPVAWLNEEKKIIYWHNTHEIDDYHGFKRTTPLYTAPPAQRKPLPPQSPCEMTQAEGKMFKLGWLECEAAHGIKGEA